MKANPVQLFQSITLMQMLLTLFIMVVMFVTVLISGRSSIARTLIAIGLGLQGFTSLAFLAVMFARIVHTPIGDEFEWITYSVLRMIDIVGFLLMLIGVVQLIRRASLLEAIQEDNENR